MEMDTFTRETAFINWLFLFFEKFLLYNGNKVVLSEQNSFQKLIGVSESTGLTLVTTHVRKIKKHNPDLSGLLKMKV